MDRRKMYAVYLNDAEIKQVEMLGKRLSPDKNIPIGRIMRIIVLAVAKNPELDYLFIDKVRRLDKSLDINDVVLRAKVFQEVDKIIEIVKRHDLMTDLDD